MKMILLRHGESEANRLNVFSNTGWKHGLTEKGREQALENSRTAQGLYRNVRAIYSSPLQRAVETAEIISRVLNVPYQADPRIIEFSVGMQEGSADKAHWENFLHLWDEWFLRGNLSARIEGGENVPEITARVSSLFDEAAALYSEPTDEVLCIGHGGTWKCAVPVLTGKPAFPEVHPYWIGHISRIELEWTAGKGGCCLKFGELSLDPSDSSRTR